MNGVETPYPSRGIHLVKIATLYLVIGLVLGTAMAASHQFQLRPVHTHLNLLGWATMALAGLVYCTFARVAESRLAAWHFWLHNIGLPVMMLGLTAYSLGSPQFEPIIALGALLVTAGLCLFAISVFLHMRPVRGAEVVNARRQHVSVG